MPGPPQHDVADDEYQAPFARPVAQQPAAGAEGTADPPPAFPASPFFSDKESVEAAQWLQNGSHLDGDPQDEEEGLESNAAPVMTGRGRARRDSQIGNYNDSGSIFDGPSAGAVPSSVTSCVQHGRNALL